MKLNEYMRKIGRAGGLKGGLAITPAKARASRLNGRKGGRPPKSPQNLPGTRPKAKRLFPPMKSSKPPRRAKPAQKTALPLPLPPLAVSLMPEPPLLQVQLAPDLKLMIFRMNLSPGS